MSFTQGGPKRPMPSKGTDKALPTKPGFTGADGTGMQSEHMASGMTDGGKAGPAKGKSFGKKYGTAAMSQAVRGRKMPIAQTVD